MPTALVKTAKDEGKWADAKAYCRKEGRTGKAFWKCVTGTFMRMKGGHAATAARIAAKHRK